MYLTVLAIAAMDLQPEKSSLRTIKATVLLLRAEGVTADAWRTSLRKSERVIVDRDGRRVLLRTIEHE
jgi:hypothetical protein